jgi:hypothetical protein
MGKKGEIGLAHVLSMYQSFPWLLFKVEMLKKSLKNFDSWFPEIQIENEEPRLIHEMIKLESVVTTVHYAEVLAANLLAFRMRRKTFHKTLLSYKGEDIISFYVRIRHRPLTYIAKLLGYPALFQIRSKKGRAALMNSCKYVKKRLSEIGDYYLRFNSLYNAYKHGFRIGVFESGVPDEKPYAVILWPPEREKLAEAIVMRLGLDVEPEYEMCQFMTSVLGSVTQTFIQRVLKKESSFTARAFGPKLDA